MSVQILTEPFNPWNAIEQHQSEAFGERADYGATASFVGTMRDFNEGDGVRGMVLEHYAGMTEGYLQDISRQAKERWSILETLIVHRVGPLKPTDPIVLVSVWSAHRKDAFEACRWLMEELKSNAPFWKRETLDDDSNRWVENNTAGY